MGCGRDPVFVIVVDVGHDGLFFRRQPGDQTFGDANVRSNLISMVALDCLVERFNEVMEY